MVSQAFSLEGGFSPSTKSTGDSTAAFQNELASLQKPPSSDRHGIQSAIAAPAADIPTPAAAAAALDMPAPAAAAAPSFADNSSWPQIQPVLKNASSVNFTSAADNATAGVQPDYFLGADGKLTPNPNKKTPPKDGAVNIQLEGNKSEIDAKKLANDLQKQSIKDLIGYMKRDNPRAKIPQAWLNILNSQADLPAPTAVQPTDSGPQQQSGGADSTDYGPSASPGGTPSGDQRVGNANVGEAPSSGYQRGELNDNPAPANNGAIPPPVAGDLNICLNGKEPSCTVDQIQKFLTDVGSPAAKEPGFAQTMYDEGVKHNIDPAVAVGFFLQESTCGRYGHAHNNHSVGNIKGSGPDGTDGEFRKYHNWSEGAKDWYNLIDNHYVHGRNLESLSQIIHVYAPNGDMANNEREYAGVVKGIVHNFQAENAQNPHTTVAANTPQTMSG